MSKKHISYCQMCLNALDYTETLNSISLKHEDNMTP